MLCVPQLLIDNLDPEDVMSTLLTLLHRQEKSLSQSWSVIVLLHKHSTNQKKQPSGVLNFLPCRLPALTEAVRLLSGPWIGSGERLQTVGWRLLPLLVVSSDSSSQLSLASCISHSSIMTQHPLAQNWAKGKLEPGVMPSVVRPAAADEAAMKKLFQNMLFVASCSREIIT